MNMTLATAKTASQTGQQQALHAETDTISTQDFEFSASDGYTLGGRRYLPPSHTAVQAKLIVASATGVPHGFYRRFAEYLAALGYAVLCFDYRGIGVSAPASLKGFEMNYLDWGRLDLSAAIDAIYDPALPLFIVGHSYGGQALGLTRNHDKVTACYTFGTGAGWSGYMPLPERLKVDVIWNLVFPFMARKDGYIAWSKFNMGEDLPMGVYRQWRKWCKSPEYFFADQDLAELHDQYAQVKTPIYAATALDDDWALPLSRHAFMKYYRNAPMQYVDFQAQDFALKKIGHMGYFKKDAVAIWDQVVQTFADYLATPPESLTP